MEKNWKEKPVTRSLDKDNVLITTYEIILEESGKDRSEEHTSELQSH